MSNAKAIISCLMLLLAFPSAKSLASINISNLNIINNQDLRNEVARYYRNEANCNWKETYRARPAAFRDIVPFDTYKNKMSESTSGWKIKNITIEKSETNENTAVITISFYEEFDDSVAKKYFSSRVHQGMNHYIEDTQWVNFSNHWYAKYPGARTHIPLNSFQVE